MIKARHVVERPLDLVDELTGRRCPGFEVEISPGIETGPEQLDELSGNVNIAAQRLCEVALAVGEADLPQVAADGSQRTDVAPVEIGPHDQRVETVGLAVAAVGGREGVHEPLPRLGGPAGTDGVGAAWNPYPEVVDERPLVLAHGELVRPLVNDVDAEEREVRHNLRQ